MQTQRKNETGYLSLEASLQSSGEAQLNTEDYKIRGEKRDAAGEEVFISFREQE